jgi:hypothetical protein
MAWLRVSAKWSRSKYCVMTGNAPMNWVFKRAAAFMSRPPRQGKAFPTCPGCQNPAKLSPEKPRRGVRNVST